MATHGRTGLARTILGSVAALVSERAPDPVFLLRL
jgi:nucleotide-binding universal stress UspA family protein